MTASSPPPLSLASVSYSLSNVKAELDEHEAGLTGLSPLSSLAGLPGLPALPGMAAAPSRDEEAEHTARDGQEAETESEAAAGATQQNAYISALLRTSPSPSLYDSPSR